MHRTWASWLIPSFSIESKRIESNRIGLRCSPSVGATLLPTSPWLMMSQSPSPSPMNKLAGKTLLNYAFIWLPDIWISGYLRTRKMSAPLRILIDARRTKTKTNRNGVNANRRKMVNEFWGSRRRKKWKKKNNEERGHKCLGKTNKQTNK